MPHGDRMETEETLMVMSGNIALLDRSGDSPHFASMLLFSYHHLGCISSTAQRFIGFGLSDTKEVSTCVFIGRSAWLLITISFVFISISEAHTSPGTISSANRMAWRNLHKAALSQSPGRVRSSHPNSRMQLLGVFVLEKWHAAERTVDMVLEKPVINAMLMEGVAALQTPDLLLLADGVEADGAKGGQHGI